jgi:quercetin dioxygenase-like cupin family protein
MPRKFAPGPIRAADGEVLLHRHADCTLNAIPNHGDAARATRMTRILPMSFLKPREHQRFSEEKMQKVNLFESPQMFSDTYCLEPGQEQKIHSHTDATKVYYVLEGEARVTIGESTEVLSPGSMAWALAGEPHGVRNDSGARCVLLVAMAPNPN